MHCLIVLYIRMPIAEMKIWLNVFFLNKILKQEHNVKSQCVNQTIHFFFDFVIIGLWYKGL